MLDTWVTQIIAHHTLSCDPPVQTSTGPSSTYFDGISSLLCKKCRFDVIAYYRTQIGKLWPVATGASGSAILAALGTGTYVQPPSKRTGPLLRNSPPSSKRDLCLVDDCAFTGNTLEYLRMAALTYDLGTVQKVVVMLDKRKQPPK